MTLRTLVYVRQYLKKPYLLMFGAVPGLRVDYLTDFPTAGMTDIRSAFYRALKTRRKDRLALFPIEDVILRCRLLRNIDRTLAVDMATAMHKLLDDIVSAHRYTCIAGPMVDDYVSHLLCILAEKRDIPYVGFCESYFPGHTQVTLYSRGEPLAVRTVPDEEVDSVAARITVHNFRQDYSQLRTYSLGTHIGRVLRYHAKRSAFAFMRFYRNDPLNVHFMSQRFLGQHKSLANYARPTNFHADWEDRLRNAHHRPLVYLPLSFAPEASIDYWVPNVRFIDYDRMTLDVVAALSARYTVIVKEHFHMLGIRDRRFYAKLACVGDVILVPPAVNSNYLVTSYRPKMLVGGGSPGLEGSLRGIPVATFCPASYWSSASGAKFVACHDLANLPKELDELRPPQVEQHGFLRRCLQTMLTFDYLRSSSLSEHHYTEVRAFVSPAESAAEVRRSALVQ